MNFKPLTLIFPPADVYERPERIRVCRENQLQLSATEKAIKEHFFREIQYLLLPPLSVLVRILVGRGKKINNEIYKPRNGPN